MPELGPQYGPTLCIRAPSSAAEAAHLLTLGRPRMSRAGVTSDSGGSRNSQGRNGDNGWLAHDADPQVLLYARALRVVPPVLTHPRR